MDNEETNTTTEEVEPNVEGAETQPADDDQALDIDSNTTVEKLKGRLNRETATKHNLEKQLAEAQQQLADIQSGKKGIKELSSEEKAEQEAKAKDDEIASLKAQIERNKTLDETRQVFKESGISEYLNDDALNMIVTDKDETTFSNIKSISDVIQSAYDAGRKLGLRGETPKETGKPTPTSSGEDLNKFRITQ